MGSVGRNTCALVMRMHAQSIIEQHHLGPEAVVEWARLVSTRAVLWAARAARPPEPVLDFEMISRQDLQSPVLDFEIIM